MNGLDICLLLGEVDERFIFEMLDWKENEKKFKKTEKREKKPLQNRFFRCIIKYNYVTGRVCRRKFDFLFFWR